MVVIEEIILLHPTLFFLVSGYQQTYLGALWVAQYHRYPHAEKKAIQEL